MYKKFNQYKCACCGETIITLQINGTEERAIPALIDCVKEGCPGTMYSFFHQISQERQDAGYVWNFQNQEESKDPFLRELSRQGTLVLRKIDKKSEKIYT